MRSMIVQQMQSEYAGDQKTHETISLSQKTTKTRPVPFCFPVPEYKERAERVNPKTSGFRP